MDIADFEKIQFKFFYTKVLQTYLAMKPSTVAHLTYLQELEKHCKTFEMDDQAKFK